ncbi:MAG: MBOAT family protein [Acidimicrobiia bacterium]|nr:MBOAT family protein [Acidimicrobiia bacterium]
MQIYFDFSGYADMAIGLGLCFGFRFPENVLRPLASISITDFWRRWHITLSAWFRDYVFIPLGGSKGTRTTDVQPVFVYILVGIWHGANWTFVAFGVFHATFLVVEAATGQNVSDPSQVRFVAVRRVFYVLVIVMSLTLFRATNLSQAFDMFSNMFSFHNGAIPAAVKLTMTTRNVVLLIFAWSTWFLPPRFSTGVWLASARGPRVAVGVRRCWASLCHTLECSSRPVPSSLSSTSPSEPMNNDPSSRNNHDPPETVPTAPGYRRCRIGFECARNPGA